MLLVTKPAEEDKNLKVSSAEMTKQQLKLVRTWYVFNSIVPGTKYKIFLRNAANIKRVPGPVAPKRSYVVVTLTNRDNTVGGHSTGSK